MMIKKLSVVFVLAVGLIALLLSRPEKMQLAAQPPTGPVKGNPLAGVSHSREAEVGEGSASASYSLYGSGDFFFPPYLSDNERMGFNKSSDHDSAVLNAGWYNDWGSRTNPPHPGGVEYVQTIYFNVRDVAYCQAAAQHSQVTVNITGTALIERAQALPGALWVVGNEPDSYYNGSPLQPQLYAELYHYFYTTLKAADPTAKVAIASVVQPSPTRIQYLDKALDHYQTTYGQPLPADLWGLHLYRLNEGACGSSWGAAVPPGSSGSGWNINFSASDILNLSEIEQSVRDFRQWMYGRGYGDIPLIITEYGVLPPPSYSGFSDAVAAQFLEDTTNMFLTITNTTTGLEADGDRLMQMWAWFSTDHTPPAGYFKYGGDLFTAGGELTVIGNKFIELADAHYTPYIDLQPAPPTSLITSARRITVSAYIQNRSRLTATNAKATLSIVEVDSGLTISQRKFDLGTIAGRYKGVSPKVEHTWQFTFTEAPVATAPYSINIAIASPDDNPANNVLSLRTNWWLLTDLIDLSVADIKLSAETDFLYRGPLTMVATATVINAGDTPSLETHFRFLLERDNAGEIELTPLKAVPPLQPGDSAAFTTTLSITQPGEFTLTAALPEAIGQIEVVDNNRLSQKINAVDPDDVLITKTGPQTAAMNSPIVYTLEVDTPVTLTNVVITDVIPLGATYLDGGSKTGNVVSWTAPIIAANEPVFFTFTVTATEMIINEDYGLTIDNELHIKGKKAAATLIEGQEGVLRISKIAPPITIPGAPVIYTLTVVNNSPITLANLLITDAIPAGASYITGGFRVGNVVSWTASALPAGAQMQAAFAVTTSTPITNSDYRVNAVGGALSAGGQESLVTLIGREILVDPALGTTIITDAPGISVTEFLSIEIPAGAFSESLTLIYRAVPPPAAKLASSGLGFTDLLFYLQVAFQGSSSLLLPLLKPMTITVNYSNTAVSDERKLGIYVFDETEGKWQPAPASCSGSGNLRIFPDFESKTIQATACRLGQFALLQELQAIYLPLILK